MPPPARHTASARSVWTIWALVWVLALGAVAYQFWRSREAALARDRSLLGKHALAIEQNLVHQLGGVDTALAGVRYLLTAADLQGHPEAVPPQLKLLADAMPGVGAITVLDVKGIAIAASRRDLVGRDFHARSYFQTTRDDPDPAVLHVSPPLRSSQGSYTTVLSRHMLGMDGRFAGVVVASLDAEYFDIVLRTALYADDARATIAHGNGVVLLSAPANVALPPGLELNGPASLFRQHMASGATASVLQGHAVDNEEQRVVATRTISPPAMHMDHPLVVRMSRSTDAVLEAWYGEVLHSAVLLALAMGASAAWLARYRHQRRLQERTERAAAQAERDSARRLEVGLRGADLGLWEWNTADGSVRASARTLEIVGRPASEAALGPDDWRAALHPDDVAENQRAMSAHLRGETPIFRMEQRYRHRDGHYVWVLAQAMVMERDDAGKALLVVGTHLDISERRRAQLELERANAQLEAISLTDGLTGVGNRRRFDLDLAAAWMRAERQQQPIALLMLDVDHFKLYNDRLGHPAGDACLRVVADALSAALRQPAEQLARYGGEEFAVLLSAADADTGIRVAQRCMEALARRRLPHPASPLGPFVTLSIGVASMLPRPGLAAAQLLQSADAALYRAKQEGRARHALAPDGQSADAVRAS